MDPFQARGNTDRERVLEALKGYPYSFQMKDMDKVQPKAFSNLRKHLEDGLRAGYSTSLETARVGNLLAFALFRLGEHQQGLDQVETVLEMEDQHNNIVSLANKAHMLSLLSSLDEAQEVVAKLQQLTEDADGFDYLTVLARAELASSYMRFGPLFNQYAATEFTDVLQRAREPEVWMWKFGLAVTYRQSLNLQCVPYSRRADSATHRDAMRLLQDVIGSNPAPGGEAASINLKANAHVEMGLLLCSTWDRNKKIDLCFQAHTGPMASCKKALELDKNDASVLWKAGKIFRYYRDVSKSKELLENSVKVQPTTSAYHHLGLTFKAMATNAQHGNHPKTRRGGRRQKERRQNREEKAKRQAVDGAVGQPGTHRQSGATGVAKTIRERDGAEQIKRMVKSPNDTTQFDPTDHNVHAAFKYLKLAVEFSCGENSRAIYDLALMYKATKQTSLAIKTLDSITQRQHRDVGTPSGLLDQIAAFDQKGLIYRDMADVEANRSKRETCLKKSENNSDRALQTAADYYSKIIEVKHLFGHIFHFPSALLKAVDAAEQSEEDKRKRKIGIFNLINDPQKAQALLDELPREEHDEKFQKLKIEADFKGGKPEKAAARLSSLEPTQYSKVRRLFESQQDVHSVAEIYFQAGRRALLDGSCIVSYMYFIKAFRESVNPPGTVGPTEQPPVCTTQRQGPPVSSPPGPEAPERSSNSPESEGVLDILLLHDIEDEFIEDKAVRLKQVLKEVCGLNVVRRNENYKLGTLELNTILRNIDQSRLVIVLPGKEPMTEMFKCNFVDCASQRRNTVVLLMEGIGAEAVPRELRTRHHRVLDCPPQLFAPDLHLDGQACSKATVDSICCLFQFLTNSE